jgi:hypothetical protein
MMGRGKEGDARDRPETRSQTRGEENATGGEIETDRALLR